MNNTTPYNELLLYQYSLFKGDIPHGAPEKGARKKEMKIFILARVV